MCLRRHCACGPQERSGTHDHTVCGCITHTHTLPLTPPITAQVRNSSLQTDNGNVWRVKEAWQPYKTNQRGLTLERLGPCCPSKPLKKVTLHLYIFKYQKGPVYVCFMYNGLCCLRNGVSITGLERRKCYATQGHLRAVCTSVCTTAVRPESYVVGALPTVGICSIALHL